MPSLGAFTGRGAQRTGRRGGRGTPADRGLSDIGHWTERGTRASLSYDERRTHGSEFEGQDLQRQDTQGRRPTPDVAQRFGNLRVEEPSYITFEEEHAGRYLTRSTTHDSNSQLHFATPTLHDTQHQDQQSPSDTMEGLGTLLRSLRDDMKRMSTTIVDMKSQISENKEELTRPATSRRP